MKKALLLILILLLSFSAIISAEKHPEGEEISFEVNEKFIDLSGMKIHPVKLVANYQSDYRDLIRQIKEQDNEYKQMTKKLNAESTPNEEIVELQNLLSRFEADFHNTATELLATRYTNDKKQIRPEIIKGYKRAQKSQEINDSNSSSSFFSTQSVYDRTWTTGNYGDTSKSGSFTNAWYRHNIKANWGHVYVDTSYWAASAATLNGVEFIASVDGNTDIKFRGVLESARLICGDENSYAAYEVKSILYDATANQYREFRSLRSVCDKEQAYTEVDEGPSIITMSNYAVQNGRSYRAYLRTFGESFAGRVDAGDIVGGTKWEYIDLIYTIVGIN